VLCVLLVRFSSIGDILLTTPLVRALARRHPDAKLVYVTKRAMAPLVADNPHLAEVVALEPDEPIRHFPENEINVVVVGGETNGYWRIMGAKYRKTISVDAWR